jgi:hypothetical protein
MRAAVLLTGHEERLDALLEMPVNCTSTLLAGMGPRKF